MYYALCRCILMHYMPFVVDHLCMMSLYILYRTFNCTTLKDSTVYSSKLKLRDSYMKYIPEAPVMWCI